MINDFRSRFVLEKYSIRNYDVRSIAMIFSDTSVFNLNLLQSTLMN